MEATDSLTSKIILPADYYLKNFCQILESVLLRYSDLLTNRELDFAQNFPNFPKDSQRLFVRVISRKGPWFRIDKLKYDDIENVQYSADFNLNCGLFLHDSSAELLQLLSLLTLPELKDAVKNIQKLKSIQIPVEKLRKENFVSLLHENYLEAELREMISANLRALKSAYEDELRVFYLLFFGNQSQDITEFVLQDLGITKFESYSVRTEDRLFENREIVCQRIELRDKYTRHCNFLDEGNLEGAIEIAEELLERMGRLDKRVVFRAQKILLNTARFLERYESFEAAMKFYEAVDISPSKERRVRILYKLGHFQNALTLIQQIACSPENETEKCFSQSFMGKIMNALCLKHSPVRTYTPKSTAYKIRKVDYMSVEQHVLENLNLQGKSGFFAENHLWRNLFGLAFWDIIFMPVKGVFQHPFQRAPLDLYTPQFRHAREHVITLRLTEISVKPDMCVEILEKFHLKRGYSNPFVSWDETSKTQITTVLTYLSGALLARVFERMIFDLKKNCCGFPDLFVFSLSTSDFEFWEVKGPGDTLRPEQSAWLELFHSWGVPVSVVKVTWDK